MEAAASTIPPCFLYSGHQSLHAASMAGSRRRRRRRRRGEAQSLQQGAESSSLADGTLSTSEVTIVEKSGSTSSTSSGPYVCADLLESLLHEIIVLINSFQDFLAFTGTCHSWRAAVSSFLSVYAFSFPPLHFEPHGPYVPPHSGYIKPLRMSSCKWKLSDLTKKNLSLQCSVPQNTPNEMHYLGCSHGYLIFTYEEHCLLIDAYTGAKVKAPELPRDITIGFFSGIGVLTAPFGSPNSRLLLFSKDSMFEWQVGTNSWSEHPLYLERERICQVVSFKGHILVIDALMRLHTIQLTPQFSVNRIEVSWWSLQKFPICPLLVVCGDMLLLVNLSIAKIGSTRNFGEPSIRYFEVFRLDLSVKPAKWIQMKKLENLVLFLSLDRRNPAFSCMNPERWGGKSNCIYVARLFDDANPDETWTVLEVGQSVPSHDIVDPMPYGMGFPPDYSLIGSFWLFPSLVYGVGQ